MGASAHVRSQLTLIAVKVALAPSGPDSAQSVLVVSAGVMSASPIE
jgi:hypothetical protein